MGSTIKDLTLQLCNEYGAEAVVVMLPKGIMVQIHPDSKYPKAIFCELKDALRKCRINEMDAASNSMETH